MNVLDAVREMVHDVILEAGATPTFVSSRHLQVLSVNTPIRVLILSESVAIYSLKNGMWSLIASCEFVNPEFDDNLRSHIRDLLQ